MSDIYHLGAFVDPSPYAFRGLVCHPILVVQRLDAIPPSITALRRKHAAHRAQFRAIQHIAPHANGLLLPWTKGDSFANMVAAIQIGAVNFINLVQRAEDARYDCDTGTIRTGEGRLLSNEIVGDWKDQSWRSGAQSVGAATIKRGVLLNTLARAKSGQQSKLLERVIRQPRQLVTRHIRPTEREQV